MKTVDKEIDNINQELAESTLAYLYDLLATIEMEIQDESTYGVDQETGTLTQEAQQRISRLQREERKTLVRINELELQIEELKPVPEKIEEGEFDLIVTLNQYEREQREYEEQKALREIQEVREQGQSLDKSHELTR